MVLNEIPLVHATVVSRRFAGKIENPEMQVPFGRLRGLCL